MKIKNYKILVCECGHKTAIINKKNVGKFLCTGCGRWCKIKKTINSKSKK